MIASLSVDGLAVRRGERRLFEGLSLELAAGEALALTGPNGSGKTSLIRAIAGLVRPEAGEIRFTGAAGPIEPQDARAEGLHLVGHHDGLSGARTAGEELTFQAGWTGGEAVEAAIESLDLAPLLKLEVRRLSAGQRRRLALARLIASPRPLWLLDEPLSPLDAAWRSRFGELMAAHIANGGLLIAAVHDPLPLAARSLDLAA